MGSQLRARLHHSRKRQGHGIVGDKCSGPQALVLPGPWLMWPVPLGQLQGSPLGQTGEAQNS